jgi:hypothetical protein
MPACMRCGTQIPADPEAVIDLCDACVPSREVCHVGGHEWRGSKRGDGTWYCVRCPARIGAQRLSTDIVQAPTPTLPADEY